MTSTSVRAEFPNPVGTPPAPRQRARIRSLGLPASFLAPAAILLGIWLIYPMIATVVRAFFDDRGDKFVWFENFDRMFSDPIIHTAIKNNVIWILVAPIAVTAFGLLLAVLTERIVWASALKIVLFMPLAISLFAVGVIWRIMYREDTEQGAINASLKVVHDVFKDEGVLPDARPSSDAVSDRFIFTKELSAGDTALLGLTAISPRDVPEGATQAVEPQSSSGAITGVVWRDFSPGGGTPGTVENGELGIPGVTLNLLRGSNTIETATSENDGSFEFADVTGSGYRVQVAPKTFAQPYGGVSWLGTSLITPSIIIAFLWTSVGFAMVIIGAGLSAIPRDVLEAARTDGGSELQIFRRVTIPLLMPVLTVVFVTQMIGVLKIFDLIYAIAPGSVQNDATTLAFEMWKRSFSGQNNFGLGAAIAAFLMLLFLPFLIYQVRSQRRNL
jgi:alpha-glucoside transport system permease protein